MAAKYEPCSICEEYIEGVACTKDQCPVAKMKAENERLEKRLEEEKHALFEQQAYTAKLQAEIEELQKRIVNWRADMNYDPKKVRAEAIKEFWDRLEKDFPNLFAGQHPCTLSEIDFLVKELTEEQNGNL